MGWCGEPACIVDGWMYTHMHQHLATTQNDLNLVASYLIELGRLMLLYA